MLMKTMDDTTATPKTNVDINLEVTKAFNAFMEYQNIENHLKNASDKTKVNIAMFPGEGGLSPIRNSIAGAPYLNYQSIKGNEAFQAFQRAAGHHGYTVTRAEKDPIATIIELTLEKQ